MTEDTYNAPPHGWTCFHCGETFTTPGSARDHFGTTPDEKPGCVLKVELGGQRGLIMELRRLQDQVRDLLADVSDETTFYRDYHAKLASDVQQFKPFKKCRSLTDVFNEFDSMEGRALAAEEQVVDLRRRVRLMARALVFYARAQHLVGFGEWEAPDQPNWDCPPVELPTQQSWESMMVENGGWAAAVLRKVFGRRVDRYGRCGLFGLKPAQFCTEHELAKPCSVCERIRERTCGCYSCVEARGVMINGIPETHSRMIVCETCGNKRCPHGTYHAHACTNSNEPGQPGSRYAA